MPRHPQRDATPEPHRPTVLKVYVTPEELADLRERAGRYTHGSISAYLREAGLHRRMEALPPPPPKVNLEAWAQAARGFGLLNQAMAHLNKGNIWTDAQDRAYFHRLLTELMAAVNEVRLLLVRRTA